MPLVDVINKERIIHTPYAQDLAKLPKDWESRFRFHVGTYIVFEDIEHKWNAIIGNLINKGRSATGLIYADTGYGKTATGVSLWDYAESKGLVAVPPFRWDSLDDMLTATHGYVCYRLESTRPDLIQNLEKKHQEVISVDEEMLATRRAREDGVPLEQSQKMISGLRAEGRLLNSLSSRQLFDYLQFATKRVLEAGYKGLLILPDEFELFKNNPDMAQNYQQLKGFIFDIHEEKNLPIGCVVLTYNETIADIRLREEHILPRFSEPEGSHIDLEQFYGRTEFAKDLWKTLSISCKLSEKEKEAIDEDILEVLGQFLRHQRSTELISGPRSVVATFRRAALHYTEKDRPYSLFDFCEDYLSGNISFSGQEVETAKAHTQIMALPVINNKTSRNLVKLLCVHPEGVPQEIFQQHDIPNPETIIEALLPEHVVTTVTGPTLKHYANDGGIPPLIEILKILKTQFRPKNIDVHRGAIRAFKKYVLPTIFTMKRQERLGWNLVADTTENSDHHFRSELKGTVLREYPDRTLTVDIDTGIETTSTSSQLHVRFILNSDPNATSTCEVNLSGVVFGFNIMTPIDSQKIPADLIYLGELFMPRSITPLLLLSILDFFDQESITSIVERERLSSEIEPLKAYILNELIGYFFSPDLKDETVIESLDISADFASVPTGRKFVEDLLRIFIPKRFPHYSAIAVSNGWQRYLGTYTDALTKEITLGRKHGIEPIKTINRNIPDLFNMGQMTAFQNFHSGAGRKLLRIDEIDTSGNTVRKGIDPRNNNTDVDVYLTTHPLEKLLVEQLHASPDTVLIDDKELNAIRFSKIYQEACDLGYLKEEVEVLLDILKARRIADRQLVETDSDYLYLMETSINFADLKIKLGKIEKNVALAQSNGFEHQCADLNSAQMLVGTLGIEHDEVQKDKLHQNLNSAEARLKNKCAEWVKSGYEDLKQKINILETLHLQVPIVLDQQTGHPLTKFSQILFQSVQPKVKSAYTKISDRIRKIQAQIRNVCDQEVQVYQSDLTPQKAIETAARLQQTASSINTDIERLSEKRDDAQELHRLFEPWRALARQIEGDRQLMTDSPEDSAVAPLIERLDAVQREIRQHLANEKLNLKCILGNHEHFQTLVVAVKTEFDEFLGGKEKAFIAYQAELEKLLRDVIDTPHIGVKWNPADSEGCYRDTREKAVEKLKKNVIDAAQDKLGNLIRDLRGPIETYAVPDSLKTSAIQLHQDVEQYAEEFQKIRSDLIIENLDQQLSVWISELVSLRQKGEGILNRQQEIETDMAGFRNQLNPSTQRLHEAVNPLLDDGTFNSPNEIIERLEELYQLHQK